MTNNIKNVQKESTANVDFSNGYTFDFNDNGRMINVYGSAWTGKETVSFEGEVIVNKRSFSRKSTLEFSIADDSYEVELNMVDMFRGELHCTLIKNGVHCKTLKKALANKYQLTKTSSWQLLILFFLGGFFGYTAVNLIMKFFGE